jgi:hypothetical protein
MPMGRKKGSSGQTWSKEIEENNWEERENVVIGAPLKDESQKRETSETNLKKQENCELRFNYLSEQS